MSLYTRAFDLPDIASEFTGHVEIRFQSCADCGVSFFSPMLAGSERFYDHLRRFDWYYTAEKSEFSFAASLIPPGAVVLDVGCGEGAFARSIPHARYLGLEFNPAARELAARNGATVLIESVEAHARRCPAAYDAVCAFQVLEHVADVRAFVEACVVCAKEDGLVIFSVPGADSFMGHAVNHALNLPPHHLTWWTDESLRRLGALFDLQVVDVKPEPLATAHHTLYLHTRLARALGGGRRLVDRSLRHRIVSKLAFALARPLTPLLGRMLRDSRGHSVTAVYRKTTHHASA